MCPVKGMGSLCSHFLQRCLGVSPSLSLNNLDSKTRTVSLPVASVAKKFKAAETRALSTSFSSVHGAIRYARKGWKWRHQQILGVVCQGHFDPGNYDHKRWNKANSRAIRDLHYCKGCVRKCLYSCEWWLICNQLQAMWGLLLHAQPHWDLGCPRAPTGAIVGGMTRSSHCDDQAVIKQEKQIHLFL